MSVDAETPLVTTVVTSFNHVAYIRRAVDSALGQSGPFRHEILLSDDGSTDGTAAVMAEYAAKFPEVVKNISSKSTRGFDPLASDLWYDSMMGQANLVKRS